ncbi:MAG: hypothetical protein HYV75_02240 [Opitutae bacterium]|nr:hypothetical protein [Opitutae bacterium]
MNTCEYIPSLPPHPAPNRPDGRRPLAWLQRLIDTAGLVSVDLTDSIFASPGNRDALAAKYTGETSLFTDRPARRDCGGT